MLKGAELREWRNLMLRNSDSENVLKSKIHTKCLNTLLIFPYENESIIRQKFRKNSTGRQQSGFVAADQVCSVLQFGCRLGSLEQYKRTYLTIHVLHTLSSFLHFHLNSTHRTATRSAAWSQKQDNLSTYAAHKISPRYTCSCLPIYCDCSSVTTVQFRYMWQR